MLGALFARRKIRNEKAVSVQDNNFYLKVQRKAYELYQRRGGGHGSDLNDWLEAERLVRAESRR